LDGRVLAGDTVRLNFDKQTGELVFDVPEH
jgi:hypothetical protein